MTRRPIPNDTRAAVVERDGNACAYCGGDAESLDHIKPYNYDPIHEERNLVPACRLCNSIAHDKVFTSFEHKRAYIQQRRLERADAIVRRNFRLSGKPAARRFTRAQEKAIAWARSELLRRHARQSWAEITADTKVARNTLYKFATGYRGYRPLRPTLQDIFSALGREYPPDRIVRKPAVPLEQIEPMQPLGARTMGSFIATDTLHALLGKEPSKATIRKVGEGLARMINRPIPFTPGYLYNVISGAQSAGAPLAQALRGVWVAQNGGHPISGAFDPIDVYAVAGTVEPASLILARSRRCPTCLIPFVPRVPNQRYCNHVCKRRRPKAPPPPQGGSAAGVESTEGDGALLSEGESDGE